MTVLDLKSQDDSTFYLRNMYQIQINPNISLASLPSEPPPFSPPISAIWANALLFLSLLISLTCALLATLLQQWARRYVGFTQQLEYIPHRRARVREFFSEGVDKSHISSVVEALPALLHLSICLFFAGLLVWLFNIDHVVFLTVTLCTAFSAVAYLWFTLSPIFRPNSPYYAPLSPTIWSIYTGISYTVLHVLSSSIFGTSRRFHILKEDYLNRLSDGIGKTAERTARQLSPVIDVRILISTLDALREDSARAKFFEAIPGFFDSKHVNPQTHLLEEFRIKFRPVLNGFLERTFSSDLISEPARSTQLLITCLNAAFKALDTDSVSQILFHILNGGSQWGELLQSVEMAHSLRRWGKSTNDEIPHYVRRIVTQVIAGVRERDDRWISLAKAEFGVPDSVLRDKIHHGDSALLSLLIHMTRQAFRTGSWTPFILATLTQFDMSTTLPELQHEFCSLWNEIVRDAKRSGENCTAVNILREIRSAYIGLHQGTDAAPAAFSAHTNFYNPVLAQPRSYRFCDIPSHRPDSIPTPQDPVGNNLTIPTPIRATFSSAAASTTQLGDLSPRSTSLEIQGLSPDADIFIISSKANVVHAATRQAEEANNISRSPSLADLPIMQSDHTPLPTQAFLPSTPVSMRSALPVTNQNSTQLVSESIRMVTVYEGTRDLNPPVPIGHPQHPSNFADDTRTNSLPPEDPTPDLYSSGTEENPQTSVVVPHPSSHLDPHPTTIYPLMSPAPLESLSSLSIPDSRHVFDASKNPTLVSTLSRLPESNPEKDVATPWVQSDISEVSTPANPMSQSILSSSATFYKNGEVTAVPATAFSEPDPQLSPITTPAIRGGEIPVDFPSPIDSALILSDHTLHTLGSPPESSTRISSHTFPWRSSVLYSPLMPGDGVLSAHGDTSGIELPIPMVILSDTSQSSVLELDIGARAPQSGDTPHG